MGTIVVDFFDASAAISTGNSPLGTPVLIGPDILNVEPSLII
jgi:hypothetical protein